MRRMSPKMREMLIQQRTERACEIAAGLMLAAIGTLFMDAMLDIYGDDFFKRDDSP